MAQANFNQSNFNPNSANNPFNEAFRAFSNFQAPNYSPNGVFKDAFNAGRRNVEVCTAANQAIAEGAQAVIRRQVETVQANAQEAIELFKDIYSSKSPEASLSKQTEFCRNAFENYINSAREIADLASASIKQASDIVSRHLVQSAEEASRNTKKAAGQ